MGHDIHKFSSAKSFAAWLRLVSNNKVSGGKNIGNSTAKGRNYIAVALRQAANSIDNQKDHDLTPFIKRILQKRTGSSHYCYGEKTGLIIGIWLLNFSPIRKMRL